MMGLGWAVADWKNVRSGHRRLTSCTTQLNWVMLMMMVTLSICSSTSLSLKYDCQLLAGLRLRGWSPPVSTSSGPATIISDTSCSYNFLFSWHNKLSFVDLMIAEIPELCQTRVSSWQAGNPGEFSRPWLSCLPPPVLHDNTAPSDHQHWSLRTSDNHQTFWSWCQRIYYLKFNNL